jgi:hypothetical protein
VQAKAEKAPSSGVRTNLGKALCLFTRLRERQEGRSMMTGRDADVCAAATMIERTKLGFHLSTLPIATRPGPALLTFFLRRYRWKGRGQVCLEFLFFSKGRCPEASPAKPLNTSIEKRSSLRASDPCPLPIATPLRCLEIDERMWNACLVCCQRRGSAVPESRHSRPALMSPKFCLSVVMVVNRPPPELRQPCGRNAVADQAV